MNWMYLLLVIPLLMVIFWKFVLRIFLGMVIVPEKNIGLVSKKFVLFGKAKTLPDGKIIALNGESGFQADTLATGLYWGYWIWQYKIIFQQFIEVPKNRIALIAAKDGKQPEQGDGLSKSVDCQDYTNARMFLEKGGFKGRQANFLTSGLYGINTLLFDVSIADITVIDDGSVGVVTTKYGVPFPGGDEQIAGDIIEGHNKFQNFDKFLENKGQKGRQIEVIQAGNYMLNPWAVEVEKRPMTEIPIGYVGVVNAYVGEAGEDVTGDGFKHGNIVKKGQKGVWEKTLDPGKYAINPNTYKVETVPTTNIVLNWANAKNESHELDRDLCTITVRSNDGFKFNLDVSQIIHVPANEAPKVIARFGSIKNLVSQVLEPTIGNYFRNAAQNSGAIDFVNKRQEIQNLSKEKITCELEKYNVRAVDTLIGDIVLPAELMKILTDRKIAEEEKATYAMQELAQDQRKSLEASQALADKQSELVNAKQDVEIAQRKAEASVEAMKGKSKTIEMEAEAEANAKRKTASADAYETEVTGAAEAGKIEAIGKATAEAYEKQAEAIGKDNFAKFKVVETIGVNGVKIIPEILINGGNGSSSSVDALVATNLLDFIKKDDNKSDVSGPKAQSSANKIPLND